jgi:hypothetical protein
MAEFGTKPSFLNGMPNDWDRQKRTQSCSGVLMAAIQVRFLKSDTQEPTPGRTSKM